MRRTDKSLSITAWLSRDHSHRESIHLASVSASGWWFELSPLGREGSSRARRIHLLDTPRMFQPERDKSMKFLASLTLRSWH
jgi:hypothetical protein